MDDAIRWAGGEVQRVRVREDLPTGGHDVIIIGRTARGRAWWNGYEWIPLTENIAVNERIGIFLPPGTLEPLLAEGYSISPPNEAMQEHRDDAIEVRDRALGMIERVIDADLAREATLHGPKPDGPSSLRRA